MGLAGAVIGGAAISAGSSLIGGMTQASAATTAANQQAQSAANALAVQQQQFGVAQTTLQPFVGAGQNALGTLSALETPGASQTSTLQNLPGFQFASQYGTMAAQNALSAQGLGGSRGPLASAISAYNNGLASTNFNQYLSQIQNTASMGSGAASALASGALASGNSQASTLQSMGNAQASGTLGSANAISGALGGVGNSASNALLMSSILGGQNSGGLYGNIGQTLGTLQGQNNTLAGIYNGGFTS